MKRKKYLLIILLIVIILITTNPTYTKFKNFSNEIPIKGVYINLKETFNGFVFSIYTKENAYTWNDHDKDRIGYTETIRYFGIISNFFELSRTTKNATDHPVIKTN